MCERLSPNFRRVFSLLGLGVEQTVVQALRCESVLVALKDCQLNRQ